jgi:hypothetical protein
MMVFNYLKLKPSRWYRREFSISIPLWPKWLAQRLCKHESSHAVGWQDQKSISVCHDCFKCVIVPNDCNHPMDNWIVDTDVMVPTVMGGGQHLVPDTWHCTQCGQSFTREMNCPTCDLGMEITEYMGMFSGRFHCTQCGEYYFREDLE